MKRTTALAQGLEAAGVTAADLQGAMNAGGVRGAGDMSGARHLWGNSIGAYDSWSRVVGVEHADTEDTPRGKAIMQAFRAGYVRAAIEEQHNREHAAIIASIPNVSGDSAIGEHPESEALADRPRADY